MRALVSRFSGALTLGVILAGMAGCAGDVGEIDRVQPAYVKKTDLTNSSWYYRRTVVDSGETFSAYASIGTGDLFTIERIKWVIQENYLYAYRDYEWTPGAEEGEEPGNTTYHGTPVAAFPILKHFDIKYDYNAETGEKTNVRVENDTDRQWSEREYMRVDWAKNDNPNMDFIIPVQFLQTPGEASAGFYVHEDDATNPWRARIEPAKGYMDFVVDHVVFPDPYVCWIDYDFDIYDAVNCGESEIRVRHAFLKVNEEENRTYDPLFYPDSVPLTEVNPTTGEREEITDPNTNEVVREPIFERFGYYRLDRLTYDKFYTLTESGRLYRIMRFDIWKKSIDDAGNVIPYADREIDPIIYHLNWDFPEELKQTAQEVGTEWNRVFRESAAAIQGKPLDQIPNVFLIYTNACTAQNVQNYLAAHKNVRAQAEEAMGKAMSAEMSWPGADNVPHDLLDNWCAATEYFSKDLKDPFTWVQEGDPRYNMLNYITRVTPSGFSGYGPMLADPINGRIVDSTANIMGWTLENAATRALEYIDYMNGELSLDDLLLGHDAPMDMLASGDYDPRAHTYAIEDAMLAGKSAVTPEHLDELKARMGSLGPTPDSRMVPMENSSFYADRLARVQGTDLEREYLIRPEDLMLASHGTYYPGDQISDELWDQASFFTHRNEIMARRERTAQLFMQHAFDPELDLDDALVGLAKRMEGMTHEEKRLYLWRSYFKATALHEIGHNVGLRHNFAASYDALNYQDQFWNLESTPLSDQEKLDAAQPEYMYSSIMDYHGKTNGDWQGLSKYDEAAIKFGYGQIFETFADESVGGGKSLKNWMDLHDYRELIYDSTVDGQSKEPAHGPYFSSVAQMTSRNNVRWDWQANTDHNQVQTILAHEVPYRFCSDEYNGLTPTCKTFDFGANQREVQAAAYVSYKNYFIFSRFLRNRLVLDWNRALARGEMAFADTMLTYKWLYHDLNKDMDGWGNSDAFQDMATATERGLNAMSEVLAMPRPSSYYRCDFDNGVKQDTLYYTPGYINYQPLVDTSIGYGPDHDPTNGVNEICTMDDEVRIGLGDSFPLFFGFSEDYVAWTFTYLGTYWDKVAVLDQMTYPFAYYPRVPQEEDFRSYSVSLYRLYPNELNDILLGLVELDRRALASQVEVTDLDHGRVLPRAMFDLGLPTSSAPKIVPSLVRNMQLYAVLFGMAYLTSPLDSTLDFGKYTRVALKGSAHDFAAFDAVAVADRAECTMPESGRTYRAIRTAAEDGATIVDGVNRSDIAFNFVNECTDWVGRYVAAKADYEAGLATLNSMPDTDPNYEAQARLVNDLEDKRDNADGQLRSVEQLLIYMQRLNEIYEFGVGY